MRWNIAASDAGGMNRRGERRIIPGAPTGGYFYSIENKGAQLYSGMIAATSQGKGEFGFRALLAATGVALWVFSNGATRPAYDEIFSAVHCAGAHPFQALSYYMLPNNHVFFNTLNSLSFWAEDKVWSGRLLSLAAFLVFQQLVFLWLRRKMPLAQALGAALLLSLAFPTLGFASHARGYGLHLMAGLRGRFHPPKL